MIHTIEQKLFHTHLRKNNYNKNIFYTIALILFHTFHALDTFESLYIFHCKILVESRPTLVCRIHCFELDGQKNHAIVIPFL